MITEITRNDLITVPILASLFTRYAVIITLQIATCAIFPVSGGRTSPAISASRRRLGGIDNRYTFVARTQRESQTDTFRQLRGKPRRTRTSPETDQT
ncbi:MAG: hypothetical protein V1706_07490 [Pseudomonadota bacterium]